METAGRGTFAKSSCSLLRRHGALILCAILLVGCRANALRDPHAVLPPQTWHETRLPVSQVVGVPSRHLACARSYYAAAERLEDDQREGCVDFYYRSALAAWRHLEADPDPLALDRDYQAAWQVYQRGLDRLIATALEFKRLDPRGQLVIADGSLRRVVPIDYKGFAWKPCEFCEILPADDLRTSDLRQHYEARGLGVSLVAVRRSAVEELFYRQTQPFAVTAVLRPACSGAAGEDGVLTFYNPCVFDTLRVGAAAVGLRRDLSAPFAYLLREAPRRFAEGFLNPNDADVQPKLIMMEPYQRGKIPVVFIHGLWSDPMTWIDTVNTLRTQRDLYQRCQFWFFQYPTGGDLLESAAKLRADLLLARERCDPCHADEAFEQMVLIGHSMGGLVARLQVTYSSDLLWRHAAHQFFEAVRCTPAMRERLRRTFFFDPVPLVRRVVYIATPHRGSGMARRLVGRAASSLVQFSPSEREQYEQLMDSNRGVFKEYLWDAQPTAVDLLEPDNPMLQALAQMPHGRCVATHSILGTGRRTLRGEPSDGVVPISSARQSGVCSELSVPVKHEEVHRDPTSIAELARILREHAQ